MTRQILLHVGTHKTGTTTIQKFFASNSDAARKEGIYYPRTARPKRAPNGHHDLPWALMDASKKTFALPAQDVWPKTLKEIDEAGSRVTLLSSEEFSFLRLPEIKRVGEFLATDAVRVIIYLRNPLSFMVSLYKQRVKGGRLHETFSEFLRRGTHLCHYLEMIDPWREVFGRKNVEIRCFEVERARPFGMMASIIELLNVEEPQEFLQTASAATLMNASPSDQAIMLIRRLNAVEARFGSLAGTFVKKLRVSILERGSTGKLAESIASWFLPKTLTSPSDAAWLKKKSSAWRAELFLDVFGSEEIAILEP